ncbi:hypothetical protein LNKW23_39770 [Paralimibaculum aggregatum]|uniref:Uncharacterized protein n=1 Tax=Paralimibaculum aggregatum TaxID=3036245 RepID=A0ABQ6LQ19_9RHOB|nr:hypothetical protein [Limibaculum sp. NKW23]GMG84761.1 hypothetical protein LNKW23_39770 [Limibaculum sp. NKW23]
MTIDCQGKGIGATLQALKKLREHWVLIAALVSALFWARDLVVLHARLPEEVSRQGAAVAALGTRVTGIELALGLAAPGGLPPMGGGGLSGPGAGQAGRWTALAWRSALAADPHCAPERLSGELVDAAGRRHALPARIRPDLPETGGGALGLGVKPHARMGVGQARFRLQVSHRCRGRIRAELTPWFPFLLQPGVAPAAAMP